jgi:lipoprotein-anchoring transpeptidase ErfK/SrfK
MPRTFASACVITSVAASAACFLTVSEACAQAPLLDPGWQLAYPGGQRNAGGGGFVAYMFGSGPDVVPLAYQPSYYRPVLQPQAYRAAPRYYAVVPAAQLRAYQPALQSAPQYPAAAPAQEASAFPQAAPQYYAVPAQQLRAYQEPSPQYYALVPAQQTPDGRLQATAYQVAPQYYQPASAAPGYVPSTRGDMAHPMVDPKYDRQIVDYRGNEKPGTIIIDTPNFFLYLVLDGGKALRYGIGVGRPGFTWAGVKEVSAKREWPDWRPPDDMLRRRPDLPRFMPGGPENPLGARAIYLGSTLYRIHGSSEPWTIGTQVSSGCIRLRNEDVVDLYGRVKVGAKVVVI